MSFKYVSLLKNILVHERKIISHITIFHKVPFPEICLIREVLTHHSCPWATAALQPGQLSEHLQLIAGGDLSCSCCGCDRRQSGKQWSEGPSKEQEKTTSIIFVMGNFSSSHTQASKGNPAVIFFFSPEKNFGWMCVGVSFSFP